MDFEKNTGITTFGDYLISGTYHFHSGFEFIDNFVNNSGELVSLSANESFLAPNSIIIDEFISGKYSDIEVFKDFVLVNNHKYFLQKELQYNSTYKYPDTTYPFIENRIHAFIDFYKSDFPPKSLFFLLYSENKKHFTSAFERAFVQQMDLAFSLFPTELPESIKAFKSRGSGLTPSGDDFIAGVVFGFDFIEKMSGINFNEIKYNIYETSKSNNVFSNNMLRLAYHAKYFKRLQDFLNAFFYLPLDDVRPSFEQLIAVGNTSGADLLTGFFAVILKRPDGSLLKVN